MQRQQIEYVNLVRRTKSIKQNSKIVTLLNSSRLSLDSALEMYRLAYFTINSSYL